MHIYEKIVLIINANTQSYVLKNVYVKPVNSRMWNEKTLLKIGLPFYLKNYPILKYLNV